MKTSPVFAAIAALTALPCATAHTRFTTFFVNGVSQGDGVGIRLDMDGSTTTTFVNGVTSPEMACGKGGDKAVDRTLPAQAGDSISMLHRAWADGAKPGFIDPSHKGSCAVYMKKIADSGASDPWTTTSAAGDGWFKIFYDGYDATSNKWCTEKMIDNDGIMTTQIPADLGAGYYLVRSEILSLQFVANEQVQPQFYAGCAQVFLQGTGAGSVNAQTVSIPGYVDENTSALSFNIYKQPLPLPFQEFGPPVYSSGSPSKRFVQPQRYQRRPSSSASFATASSTTSSGSASSSSSSSTSNTNTASSALPSTGTTSASSSAGASGFVGSCPSGAVLEVGNWCGTEIPSWSSDTPGYLPQCWAASDACWKQGELCWKQAGPAVNLADKSSGCSLWEAKCQGIVDWCSAGNTQGPPDSGKVLTPQRTDLSGSTMAVVVKRANAILGATASKMRRGWRTTPA